MFDRWRQAARHLRHEVRALTIAAQDPRTPRRAKVLAVCIVAYALSPIDLIPDVIPVLGYVDDLILLPLAVWVALRMIPPQVMDDARAQAAQQGDGRATDWRGAVLIVALWGLAAWLVYAALRRYLSG